MILNVKRNHLGRAAAALVAAGGDAGPIRVRPVPALLTDRSIRILTACDGVVLEVAVPFVTPAGLLPGLVFTGATYAPGWLQPLITWWSPGDALAQIHVDHVDRGRLYFACDRPARNPVSPMSLAASLTWGEAHAGVHDSWLSDGGEYPPDVLGWNTHPVVTAALAALRPAGVLVREVAHSALVVLDGQHDGLTFRLTTTRSNVEIP